MDTTKSKDKKILPKEVAPPERVTVADEDYPDEMGGKVHFLESEAAEVAPSGIKIPLSRLRLTPPKPEA